MRACQGVKTVNIRLCLGLAVLTGCSASTFSVQRSKGKGKGKGCFIERISTGEIVMHQRSYIEHCLKNNEMTHLKIAKSLPCVDEKSPPEDAFDEHGHPTSFEEDKSMCQKYIGQLMWSTTRTRPDIAAVLGILASQMVIRPTYIKGCLIHLWRYVLGRINLNMYSFEPAPMQYGSLILNVYVDASFASGGGRSRSGLAMYLVNPSNGRESIIQWASRRQTSMATSAPEAEVSAMAEGFAASIFLFDTMSEIGLVSGTGPSSIMSMKTDSAVALKQLGTQSVTVRTRTAAQKLNYLRELIYDDPQVEPIYISGDSQRADGLTKILSGSALKECQKGLNLLYPSIQNEEHDCKEEIKEKTKEPEQAKIGACIVTRQAEGESSSLDSTQVGSSDNSAVLAPVCLACQASCFITAAIIWFTREEEQIGGPGGSSACAWPWPRSKAEARNCRSEDEGTSTYRSAIIINIISIKINKGTGKIIPA